MDDYETTADLDEAIHYERLDADMQQAQMIAESNRASALRKRGVCLHSSAVGLPDSGKLCYPEQEGLKPGQMRCTEGCGALFESRDEWMEAHRSF